MSTPKREANIIPVISPDVKPLPLVGVAVEPGVWGGEEVDEAEVGDGVTDTVTKNNNNNNNNDVIHWIWRTG